MSNEFPEFIPVDELPNIAIEASRRGVVAPIYAEWRVDANGKSWLRRNDLHFGVIHGVPRQLPDDGMEAGGDAWDDTDADADSDE